MMYEVRCMIYDVRSEMCGLNLIIKFCRDSFWERRKSG